jgi:hypothetical protein
VQLPLLQSFPFPSTLGEVTLHPLSQAGVFIYSAHGKWAFLLSHRRWVGVFLPLPLLQAFPHLVSGRVPQLLPSLAGLFIYSSMRDFPSPPLRHSGHPALFATCLFCCCCLLFSFFSFFPGWGLVCPGGYADLAQGCLWEYHVPLSSPCDPHLPKPSGRWHLAAAWEPSWFLHLMWSGDAMCGLGMWRSQSFASSWCFFL